MQHSWLAQFNKKISLGDQGDQGVISSDQHKDKCEYNHSNYWNNEMMHSVSSIQTPFHLPSVPLCIYRTHQVL